mmetsp:Transcript_35815/g.94922  ORF Transcript_35815/g.94922 Transcript_35815/m.94922 type:complete len:258 (-) Transcript_35815:42-815(-)
MVANARAAHKFLQWSGRRRPFAAAVLGGSGSVGRPLIRHLLALPDCQRLVLINRRHLTDIAVDGRIEQNQADMDDPQRLYDQALPALAGVDIVFNVMGLGAPSKHDKDALLKVDAVLPSAFARAAKAAQVRHAVLMTSTGADINGHYSMLTRTGAGGGWYNHVKGTCESNYAAERFQSLSIVRPSVLIGSPNTPSFMPALFSTIAWALPANLQAIDVSDLAAAMTHRALHVLARESDDQLTESTVDTLEGQSLFDLI